MSRAPSKPKPDESLIEALPTPSTGYLNRSDAPFHSLIFLLPFVILYEVGTKLFAVDPVTLGEHRIIAFNLLSDFFHLFGATGKYLPPLAVVGILLSWHIARNDPWKIRPGTLTGMAVESVVFALPLVVLGRVFIVFWQTHIPLMTGMGDWKSMIVLSIGAGIYEELIFRLIAFTVMNLILVDLLGMPKGRALLLMVVISSLAFSLYHYLGDEAFAWQSFAFRTAAGVYFGVIFVTRGFGITAGAHAVYDIFIVSMKALA